MSDSRATNDTAEADEKSLSNVSATNEPNSKDDSKQQPNVENDGSEEGEASPTAENPPLPDEPLPPPLPDEPVPPPLPDEPVPDQPQVENGKGKETKSEVQDDGWETAWDATHGAFYFYNRFTNVTQWDNPRVPDQTNAMEAANPSDSQGTGAAGGYNPAIHGDYDPTADYAVKDSGSNEIDEEKMTELAYAQHAAALGQPDYGTSATFNRFTGRFQNAEVNPTQDPSRHTDQAKSYRQMNAFFDVDAAANNNEGKSLKEERQRMKWSKKEMREFKEKRRERKEHKRRAWLLD